MVPGAGRRADRRPGPPARSRHAAGPAAGGAGPADSAGPCFESTPPAVAEAPAPPVATAPIPPVEAAAPTAPAPAQPEAAAAQDAARAQAPQQEMGSMNSGENGASWQSPGDEGWRAAEAAKKPIAAGLTPKGLPKRVPRTNLVPGSADGTGAAKATPPNLPPVRLRPCAADWPASTRACGRVATRHRRTGTRPPTPRQLPSPESRTRNERPDPSGPEPELADHQLRRPRPRRVPHRCGLRGRPLAGGVRRLPAGPGRPARGRGLRSVLADPGRGPDLRGRRGDPDRRGDGPRVPVRDGGRDGSSLAVLASSDSRHGPDRLRDGPARRPRRSRPHARPCAPNSSRPSPGKRR